MDFCLFECEHSVRQESRRTGSRWHDFVQRLPALAHVHNVTTFLQQQPQIYSLFDRRYWQNIFIIQMIYFQHFCNGTICHLAEINKHSEAAQTGFFHVLILYNDMQFRIYARANFGALNEAASSIFLFHVANTDFRNNFQPRSLRKLAPKWKLGIKCRIKGLKWSRCTKAIPDMNSKKSSLHTQTWGWNEYKMLHWHDETMIIFVWAGLRQASCQFFFTNFLKCFQDWDGVSVSSSLPFSEQLQMETFQVDVR